MRRLVLATAVCLFGLIGTSGCGRGDKPAAKPADPGAVGSEHLERARRELSEG
jgi:hypothetical protein